MSTKIRSLKILKVKFPGLRYLPIIIFKMLFARNIFVFICAGILVLTLGIAEYFDVFMFSHVLRHTLTLLRKSRPVKVMFGLATPYG